MENESLVVMSEVCGDLLEKWIGKIAVFGEEGLVFEIDEVNIWNGGGGFGFCGERDE